MLHFVVDLCCVFAYIIGAVIVSVMRHPPTPKNRIGPWEWKLQQSLSLRNRKYGNRENAKNRKWVYGNCMAYSGSHISTGRVGEDRHRVTERLGEIFGESPVLRVISGKPLPVSPMDVELLEGEVEDV